MEESSDIILVDDHVVTVALTDILLRARDGDTWTWTEKGSGALTMISSQEAADQARMEMALSSREEARRERGEAARWDHTTIRYAAAAWELPRLSLGHRARAKRILADRHWHQRNKFKGSKNVDIALDETVCEVRMDGHES